MSKHEIRSWWRRHWWPSKVRRLDRERTDWKRWAHYAENRVVDANTQLELAWGLIANAYGGNWDMASKEWEDAAKRWRDKYHTYLRGVEDDDE